MVNETSLLSHKEVIFHLLFLIVVFGVGLLEGHNIYRHLGLVIRNTVLTPLLLILNRIRL